MKLNQELLNRIQDQVASEYSDSHDFAYSYWTDLEGDLLRYGDYSILIEAWKEVCRRYSEQIIKCDGCDGSGEREFYHETLGDSPCSCSLCEGKGYLEE